MGRQLVHLPSRGVALDVDVHACRAEEGEHGLPSASGRAPPASTVLLVMHPWGWLSGSMDDLVVVNVCRSSMACGRFSHVVRYNMRGCGGGDPDEGGSPGWPSLLASTDAGDLEALAQWLLAEMPEREGGGPPASRRRLAVVAYSYGAVVAGRAVGALRADLEALVAVGLPLGLLCRFALGAGAAWSSLSGPPGYGLPRLLAVGDLDQFSDAGAVRRAVAQAQAAEAEAETGTAGGGGCCGNSGAPRSGATVPAPAPASPPGAGGQAATAGAAAGLEPGAAAASTGPAAASGGSGRGGRALELVVWPGVDHFWFGCRDEGALRAVGLLRAWEAEAEGRGREGGALQEEDVDEADEAGQGGRTRRRPLRPAAALAAYVVSWLIAKLPPR
ncbi:hypothetical protein HYH03_018722 [Edaphochlamys debaryana]|uniref:Uncharacterized protein n=1 Tax=Edaphochlamys debaryana TaxID=47281 RepID=A0A836BP32_9CHLO|nr:hypothetical protein HYH03_018722 [Edaphochlamys debaryana]|eukprot:KAG2482334.1 hypothetical protein HYH03_018722 [Edaphochlamys debaryana]